MIDPAIRRAAHEWQARMQALEARDVLLDHVAEGREVIPVGPACKGFDYKTGCPGHESEADAYPINAKDC